MSGWVNGGAGLGSGGRVGGEGAVDGVGAGGSGVGEGLEECRFALGGCLAVGFFAGAALRPLRLFPGKAGVQLGGEVAAAQLCLGGVAAEGEALVAGGIQPALDGPGLGDEQLALGFPGGAAVEVREEG